MAGRARANADFLGSATLWRQLHEPSTASSASSSYPAASPNKHFAFYKGSGFSSSCGLWRGQVKPEEESGERHTIGSSCLHPSNSPRLLDRYPNQNRMKLPTPDTDTPTRSHFLRVYALAHKEILSAKCSPPSTLQLELPLSLIHRL